MQAPQPQRPIGFLVGAIGSGLVVGLAWLLLWLEPPTGPAGYLAPLAATGLLIFAVLVRRPGPGLALASLVVGALIATTVPIAAARAMDPASAGLDEWLVAALRSIAAAIFTVSLAARYATSPERRLAGRASSLVGVVVVWFIAACVLVVVLIVTGNAAADPALTWIDVATLPTALFVDLVLLLVALGALGDLRAATLRVDARVPTTDDGGSSGSVLDRVTAVVRELLPGEDGGTAAAEAERTRLAGDIHAGVLPALRRAIADAEAGGPPELLAARLRSVDLELERLMADRWPVVLDTFGLVAALEELAERLEGETGRTIELAIVDDSGRPPVPVERAAWRVARLALDNAARHAGPAAMTIQLATGAEHVAITIADRGEGFDRAAASRGPGRGIRDMERSAREVGAELSVASPPGSGTTVRFTWPRRNAGR